MIILPDTPTPSNHTNLDAIRSHSRLTRQSASFHSLPPTVATEGDGVLYAMQGEAAVNVDADDFGIIGSDDATTCHILIAVLREGTRKRVVLAHLDTVERVFRLGQMLEQAADHCPAVDVYVSGGIGKLNDKKGDSERISAAVVAMLSRSPLSYHLQVFNTCKFMDPRRPRHSLPIIIIIIANPN